MQLRNGRVVMELIMGVVSLTQEIACRAKPVQRFLSSGIRRALEAGSRCRRARTVMCLLRLAVWAQRGAQSGRRWCAGSMEAASALRRAASTARQTAIRGRWSDTQKVEAGRFRYAGIESASLAASGGVCGAWCMPRRSSAHRAA